MRKAQLLGHIVIYIIGFVVVGFVLFFGYSVIRDLGQQQCIAERLRFSSDLTNSLQSNRAFGVGNTVRMPVPCQAAMVCFIDRRIIDAKLDDTIPDYTLSYLQNHFINAEPTGFPGLHNKLIKSIQAGAVTNIFTVETNGYITPLERYSAVSAPVMVEQLTNEPMMVCIPASEGLFVFRMEGDGRTANIVPVI